MNEKIVNEMGIYTSEQYLKLKKRAWDLWHALNYACACMDVRGSSIKSAISENKDFLRCGRIGWSSKRSLRSAE